MERNPPASGNLPGGSFARLVRERKLQRHRRRVIVFSDEASVLGVRSLERVDG